MRRVLLPLMMACLLAGLAIGGTVISERVPVKHAKPTAIVAKVNQLRETAFRLVPNDPGKYIEIYGDEESIRHAKELIGLLDIKLRALSCQAKLNLKGQSDDIAMTVSFANTGRFVVGCGSPEFIASISCRILSTGELEVSTTVDYRGGKFWLKSTTKEGEPVFLSVANMKPMDKVAEDVAGSPEAQLYPELELRFSIPSVK